MAKVLGMGRPKAHCSRVLTVVSGLVSELGSMRIVVRRPRSMNIEKLVVNLVGSWARGRGWGLGYMRRE